MKPQYLILSLLLAGCAVGPDYQRPEVALQTRFVEGNAASIGAVATQQWWLDYKDPVLTGLVSRGLAQNLDVMAATEAIRQAQANLRMTGVNSAVDGALTAQRTTSGGDAIDGTVTTNSSSLGAALVLDFFGGLQREREAAKASLTAARAEAETVRLAWLAELLSAYSDAR